MRSRIIFIVSGMGLAFALVSAFISGQQPKALAPAFNPAANPYAKGIYANGIIESVQAQGQNINIYPEVAGPITQVLVAEGAKVHKGDLLLTIDDTVQRATTEQQQSQADAAKALLEELRAEPRRETLAVATAQVDNALATLKNAQDQLAKQEQSYAIEAKSVSRDTLDNARNAEKIAATNLAVVQKQYSLIMAGAWVYDIRNQERQYAALSKAYSASAALLDKYSMKAPSDGVVRSIQATVGSYASTQGVDEILIHRLADTAKMSAEMFVRGTNLHVPLTFTRIQPYVSPKIELADGRRERVDLRVLPLIFRFAQTKALNLYPGQLVDVYVSAN